MFQFEIIANQIDKHVKNSRDRDISPNVNCVIRNFVSISITQDKFSLK